MANTVRVNADLGPDFHPLADHMTYEFSVLPFSHQLMFDASHTNNKYNMPKPSSTQRKLMGAHETTKHFS